MVNVSIEHALSMLDERCSKHTKVHLTSIGGEKEHCHSIHKQMWSHFTVDYGK